jgi:hypothetical protein
MNVQGEQCLKSREVHNTTVLLIGWFFARDAIEPEILYPTREHRLCLYMYLSSFERFPLTIPATSWQQAGWASAPETSQVFQIRMVSNWRGEWILHSCTTNRRTTTQFRSLSASTLYYTESINVRCCPLQLTFSYCIALKSSCSYALLKLCMTKCVTFRDIRDNCDR